MQPTGITSYKVLIMNWKVPLTRSNKNTKLEKMSSAETASASASATATTAATAQQLDIMQGIDIAQVLRSKGPVVKCVVLRSKINGNNDSASSRDDDDDPLKSYLVDEIELDTTPKKNEVEQVLGGPFTFIGQYEEEGIMLMALRDGILLEDDEEEEATDLQEEHHHPKRHWNPHKLQPPFDQLKISGDILVLKVAEVDDPLDEPDNNNQAQQAQQASLTALSNDEFFLHYTKEEYLKFAARDDVVPPSLPEENEQEDCGENGLVGEDVEECSGDESEQGTDGDEDEEDDEEIDEEEAKGAMLNLVLSTCLKKFREENGRGPDTQELMVLKLTVAQKLGMTLPGMAEETEDKSESEDEGEEVEAENHDEEKPAPGGIEKKRKTQEDSSRGVSPKKVKFGGEDVDDECKENTSSEHIPVH